LALNPLSDLSAEEYQAMNGVNPKLASTTHRKETFLPQRTDNKMKKLAQTASYNPLNWTNLFGPIRNQMQCGSCWAFSTTGVLEAYYNMNSTSKPYFSPQQLIDCDTVDKGCNGGWFSNALNYVKANGINYDSVYPYVSVNSTVNESCQTALQAAPQAKISSYNWCYTYSGGNHNCTEAMIYNYLANGPVSIAIDASSTDFQHYSSGIYTTACSQVDHGVILMGFGTDSVTGYQYWTIRNQWGSSWGENGYMRIQRNLANNNSCFVTNAGYVPVF